MAALGAVVSWFFQDYLGGEFAGLAAPAEVAASEAPVGQWQELHAWLMRGGSLRKLDEIALEALRLKLGLAASQVDEVRAAHARDVDTFREVVTDAVDDGVLEAHECEALELVRVTACISRREATEILSSLAPSVRFDAATAPDWIQQIAGAAQAVAQPQVRAEAQAIAHAQATPQTEARATAQAQAGADAPDAAQARADAQATPQTDAPDAAQARADAQARAAPVRIATVAPGAVLVRVAAGSFMMGTASGGRDDERPVHAVTLTRTFELWSTPVTQGQWEALMGNNPSQFKGATRPVERVSWFDAVAYCNALSRKLGLEEAYVVTGASGTPGSGKYRAAGVSWKGAGNVGFRLPTEAEWEYACRAGTTGERYGDLNAIAWHRGNSGGFFSSEQTHPVAQKTPNALGLYDTLGNVWEWVWDWKGDYLPVAQQDPTGPLSGDERVVRGGSWDGVAGIARAAVRREADPSHRSGGLGFRPSRSVP